MKREEIDDGIEWDDWGDCFLPIEEQHFKDEISDMTDINEGLIDVIFKTLKTNMKVSVSGNLIYFKWEWVLNKTFFTLRMRRKTLEDFAEWINKIVEYSSEGSGK